MDRAAPGQQAGGAGEYAAAQGPSPGEAAECPGQPWGIHSPSENIVPQKRQPAPRVSFLLLLWPFPSAPSISQAEALPSGSPGPLLLSPSSHSRQLRGYLDTLVQDIFVPTCSGTPEGRPLPAIRRRPCPASGRSRHQRVLSDRQVGLVVPGKRGGMCLDALLVLLS